MLSILEKQTLKYEQFKWGIQIKMNGYNIVRACMFFQ